MRFATYNIEWFTHLFDATGAVEANGDWSGRQDVHKDQQFHALGLVFKAMDADAILVVEAPDSGKIRRTVTALEGFAQAHGLRANRAVMGFSNDTQQEIALLYDPNTLTAKHDPQGPETAQPDSPDIPRFDTEFHIDLDVDDQPDTVVFSKPPLELAIETASGFQFRLLGAHLKSKAPYGTKSPEEAMRQSIANRRKQLAQAIWLRGRVENLLAAGQPVMVLGDLNDGPGLDEYEHLFGKSSVEIVMGMGEDRRLHDPHARLALQRRIGVVPTTSRFFIRHENRYLQALLDYIMVSDDLQARKPKWRIWHPLDDPDCWATPELRDALVTASDHFPVTLDIDL